MSWHDQVDEFGRPSSKSAWADPAAADGGAAYFDAPPPGAGAPPAPPPRAVDEYGRVSRDDFSKRKKKQQDFAEERKAGLIAQFDKATETNKIQARRARFLFLPGQ
jgi:hypothetical protein